LPDTLAGFFPRNDVPAIYVLNSPVNGRQCRFVLFFGHRLGDQA